MRSHQYVQKWVHKTLFQNKDLDNSFEVKVLAWIKMENIY